MKNSENVASTKKVRTSKKVAKVAIVENVVTKKIVPNKIQKTIKMIVNVSGATEQNVINFLIKTLANQKSKVKISEFLTKLVLRIASGSVQIPNDEATAPSEIFVAQMVEKFGLSKPQFENFLINELATKKKVVLNTFFKDMFFKASMNQVFVEKINSFKRF
jgi:hypothetical protein